MKKILALIFAVALFAQYASATCVIRYVYDAAGNRILRYYDCPDGGGDPPPTEDPGGNPASKNSHPSKNDVIEATMDDGLITNLAPNPTSAISTLTFSKELDGVYIVITDGKGSLVKRETFSGNRYSINLSNVAAGTYYINIKAANRSLTFKLDKL